MLNVLIDTDEGLKYFKKKDYTMYSLLYNSLHCENPLAVPTPKPPAQHFSTVATSIIGQQISVKAASAVKGRVLDKLRGKITPDSIKSVDFMELKNCGLSGRKTEYLKHNAEIWESIKYREFKNLPNEEVIHELTKLHGIGRWTAEMFLMFSLARPDVFSYGDLGLMNSLYQTYNYKPHYKRKIRNQVDLWSPHQTLASLALWYRLDNEPVLL
jgi:DNA-3-methyladenine glycosylase II